ncbi:MAG: amino acid deaminase/aldolase [Candidatus Hydrogenedentota bacterium]
MESRYNAYKAAFHGRPMPFAYVDLERFDANIEAIATRAAGKPVRVASKSVRCVAMLRRILEHPACSGVMAYSAREAVFLAGHGFDDILVAYPVLSEVAASGVLDTIGRGKRIILMVDCPAHLTHLDTLARQAGVVMPVCLDVDMSSCYPGIYFGVRRSPVRTPEDALAVWAACAALSHVRLVGVMGYEAQVAGVQDFGPCGFLKNKLIGVLKKRSMREVCARRAAVVQALTDAGCQLEFVNGGGTGSVDLTTREEAVTEVTAGSGFYAPTLFDHYAQFKHEPAAGYAIEIVRRPAPGIYTCQGGGYIASGAAGPDKLPQPCLPEGAGLIAQEGAGEVQTPIVYKGREQLELGGPVFMRHAKAGELCERFNTLLLLEGGEVSGEVPTYRGEGMCFV